MPKGASQRHEHSSEKEPECSLDEAKRNPGTNEKQESRIPLRSIRATAVATMDLLIGTIALVENDTLITRKARHFEKIPHLRLEPYASVERREW